MAHTSRKRALPDAFPDHFECPPIMATIPVVKPNNSTVASLLLRDFSHRPYIQLQVSNQHLSFVEFVHRVQRSHVMITTVPLSSINVQRVPPPIRRVPISSPLASLINLPRMPTRNTAVQALIYARESKMREMSAWHSQYRKVSISMHTTSKLPGSKLRGNSV